MVIYFRGIEGCTVIFNPEHLDEMREIARQFFAENQTMLGVFEAELTHARMVGQFQDMPLNAALVNELYGVGFLDMALVFPGAAIPEVKARQKRLAKAIKEWAARRGKEIAPTVTERYQPPTSGQLPKATGTIKRWTEELKAEVRTYRKKHGLQKTAEHYGVSQTIISRHVPAEKKAPDWLRGL